MGICQLPGDLLALGLSGKCFRCPHWSLAPPGPTRGHSTPALCLQVSLTTHLVVSSSSHLWVPPSISLLVKACVASLSDQFKAPGMMVSPGPGCDHREECRSRKPSASRHFSSSELGTAGGRDEGGWGEPPEAAGLGRAGLTPPQSGAGPQEEPGSRAAGEHQTGESRYGRNESRGPLLQADQETSRGEFGPQSHCA